MMKKRLLKQTTLSTKETSFCLIDEPAKQTRKNFVILTSIKKAIKC